MAWLTGVTLVSVDCRPRRPPDNITFTDDDNVFRLTVVKKPGYRLGIARHNTTQRILRFEIDFNPLTPTVAIWVQL